MIHMESWDNSGHKISFSLVPKKIVHWYMHWEMWLHVAPSVRPSLIALDCMQFHQNVTEAWRSHRKCISVKFHKNRQVG